MMGECGAIGDDSDDDDDDDVVVAAEDVVDDDGRPVAVVGLLGLMCD